MIASMPTSRPMLTKNIHDVFCEFMAVSPTSGKSNPLEEMVKEKCASGDPNCVISQYGCGLSPPKTVHVVRIVCSGPLG